MSHDLRACRGTRRGRPRADRAATPAAPGVPGRSCRGACRYGRRRARPGPPQRTKVQPGSTPHGCDDPAQCRQPHIRADPDAGAIRQRDLDAAIPRHRSRRCTLSRGRYRARQPRHRFGQHLHRHEYWRVVLRRQHTALDLLAPARQQAAADMMPPGNVGDDRTGRVGLRHDPKLVLDPPPTPTLNPGDDLHPENLPLTLTTHVRAPLRSPASRASCQRVVTGRIPSASVLHPTRRVHFPGASGRLLRRWSLAKY